MNNNKLKYIYIAGPYTNPDPVVNTAKAIEAADKLALAGYIPFVPHLTLFWHLLYHHEVQFWYKYDMAMLTKCDSLLRLPGDSPGADNEVFWAKKLGMPIYYSVEEAIDNL